VKPCCCTLRSGMPPDDWTRMVCIEAAVVARPVPLGPGHTWHGAQRLQAAPLRP